MGQIDVGAVQRHLAAAGHRLTTPAVASLLADLGFSEATHGVPSSTVDVKITASVQYPEREERRRAETPPPRRDRTPAAQTGVPRLLAKLEELERQLAVVSVSQDRLEGAWEAREEERVSRETERSSHRWSAKPALSPPQRRLLGTEAQQLRDWAQGRWPTVAAPPPPPPERRRRSGSRPPSRRTDPVARYRQLQRVWSRDPFLRSGGDCRASRRREEGFRDAFAALHSSGSGGSGATEA